MTIKKFAVWIAPERRDEIEIEDDKFWVVNNESSSYVTEEYRGLWNTYEEALEAVVEDWEEVTTVNEIEKIKYPQENIFDEYIKTISDVEKTKIIEAFDVIEQAIPEVGNYHVNMLISKIGVPHESVSYAEHELYLEKLANACYRYFWRIIVADKLRMTTFKLGDLS